MPVRYLARERTGPLRRDQADLDAAIERAPCLRVVTGDRLAGTESLYRQATVGNVAHALDPVPYSGGTGAGQMQVLRGLTGGIGVPADDNQPARLRLDPDQGID